jgi:hypothetical protein
VPLELRETVVGRAKAWPARLNGWMSVIFKMRLAELDDLAEVLIYNPLHSRDKLASKDTRVLCAASLGLVRELAVKEAQDTR